MIILSVLSNTADNVRGRDTAFLIYILKIHIDLLINFKKRLFPIFLFFFNLKEMEKMYIYIYTYYNSLLRF